MEKSEFKLYIKNRLKELGFHKRKDFYSKVMDENYLIGIDLDHSSYVKGYQFRCGIVYLPNEQRIPFRGIFDLKWNFYFPSEPGQKLDFEKRPLKYIFEYEKYTIDEFKEFFEQNYEHYIIPLYDPGYGIELIRQDWKLLKRCDPQTIERLCKRIGIEYDEVMKFLW